MVRFIRALCNIAIAGSSCYIRGAFLQDRNGTMLTFTEEIILLLLGEEDGAFLPVNSNAFECALAGATLMDLAFALRIDTDLESLIVLNENPTGITRIPVLCSGFTLPPYMLAT